MDFQRGAFGNDRQQDGHNSSNRHSSHQIARLEQVFQGCKHPDENQREKLGAELGLDPAQIKFWFQNKRIKEKNRNERYSTNNLRIENQKIQTENNILREMLNMNNRSSLACQCPASGCEEEQHISIQKLKMENALLLHQYEEVSKFLANNYGINSSDLSTLLPCLDDPSPSRRTPMAMMPSTSTLPALQTCASSSSSSWQSSEYQNMAATEPVPTFTLTPDHLDHNTPPPPPPPPPHGLTPIPILNNKNNVDANHEDINVEQSMPILNSTPWSG